ncbi:concanavalin A-like lectin/glucanase domain-containing protein [Irpex rosettiformis]|uniref:Concanavalin A-like lectin/glucanase domain-containing protein n=1 Tax=Irpex rosettiformis TaxID=378272 RepID=A0ACB8UK08_9APHY|nr:concanavalin A-like lectin/glucanase domain-containing protein [Irpex rosettiformis]
MGQEAATRSWDRKAVFTSGARVVQDTLDVFSSDRAPQVLQPGNQPTRDALYILFPLLIVLSTFLFLLLLFLICVIILRRRRGIMLRDNDGPIDMSREDLVEGEGGFETLESRWLESVPEGEQRMYQRAKQYQMQYPPNSQPTDITLSQFLSIQEKGVSAWSFEPDFEALSSLLVHARTEITFLPDPSSTTSVQSNLPLPKLNEVYYWEVKMFDLPTTTNVAVGLTTKPYPSFRLPGLCRFSVGYHSNGDKSHNWPFTAVSCGLALKEGDVLGVGCRPRTGTVFFTKNGRKMEDAYVGFNSYNLFPTVGADGPCSVHVNFGQSGFVFIEANVKKWGLAPSSGTLAPPPPYGSERGSILLAAGGDVIPITVGSPAGASSRSRRSHRSRRAARTGLASSTPIASSPLATSPVNSPSPPATPPPPITPIEEEIEGTGAITVPGPSTGRRYISPTDLPFHTAPNANIPPSPTQRTGEEEEEELGSSPRDSSSSQSPSPPARTSTRSPQTSAAGANQFDVPRRQPFTFAHSRTGSRSSYSGSELAIHVHPPPESPIAGDPPTPDIRDISLQALQSGTGSRTVSGAPSPIPERAPPAYSPLDAYAYSDGVQLDLPAEVIAAALETGTLPSNMIAPSLSSTRSGSDRRRSRRERRT